MKGYVFDDRFIVEARPGGVFFVGHLLELVASERPGILAPLLAVLEHGPASRDLAELAAVWGLDRDADLAAVAVKAAHQLNHLERRRAGWTHPAQVVDAPNCQALAHFAGARSGRVVGSARARRLDIVRRKAERVAEHERQRRELDDFLGEPSAPFDLAKFMGWPEE